MRIPNLTTRICLVVSVCVFMLSVPEVRADGACPCIADIVGPFGDCTPDGFCDSFDVRIITECMAGACPCPAADLDINCDGVLDLLDVSLVECCFAAVCPTGTCVPTAPTGACCFEDLAGFSGVTGCSLATELTCANVNIFPGATATYLGDGTSCDPNPCDCNGNGVPDGTDISSLTSADCDGNGVPDECENFGCCGPQNGQCGDASLAGCDAIGGTWMGVDCMRCPMQNVALINEGGGQIFVHVIGPPVDCDLAPAPSPEGPGCTPGQFIDAWNTEAGQGCHNFGVTGSPAIPANFFVDPGSDPFTGSICLEGVPLGPTPFGDFGTADTLVLRTQDPFDRCELPNPNPVVVSIEIVELNLKSIQPIEVMVNGQPEFWDVFVDLSSVTPTAGQLTATKDHCNGGMYTSILNVQPRFTFVKVGDPGQVRVLDTGTEAGFDPIVLDQSANPAPWVHDVDPPFDTSLDPCTSFHGGFNELAPTTSCDCNGNTVRDRCDIEQCPGGDASCQDCNGNETPDGCDIGQGQSPDGNGDGIPDECAAGPAIPAASTWGLLVMAMLILTTATIVFRRRRHVAM